MRIFIFWTLLIILIFSSTCIVLADEPRLSTSQVSEWNEFAGGGDWDGVWDCTDRTKPGLCQCARKYLSPLRTELFSASNPPTFDHYEAVYQDALDQLNTAKQQFRNVLKHCSSGFSIEYQYPPKFNKPKTPSKTTEPKPAPKPVSKPKTEPTIDPTKASFDKLFEKGMSLFNDGKYEDALAIFERALTFNPDSQVTKDMIALAKMNLGEESSTFSYNTDSCPIGKPFKATDGNTYSINLKDPGKKSGALCRDACGEDCENLCRDVGLITYEKDGLSCTYPNVVMCPTEVGCIEHDDCYDKCAMRGEKDHGGCHTACDLECIAKYGAILCGKWSGKAKMILEDPDYKNWKYFSNEPIFSNIGLFT